MADISCSWRTNVVLLTLLKNGVEMDWKILDAKKMEENGEVNPINEDGDNV